MRLVSRSLVFAFVTAGLPHSVAAQVAAPTAGKSWNADVAATVGIGPGIGAATTGLDLSGAVTVVRTTESEVFNHRCLGLTTMFTVTPHERAFLVGPRWDAGDDDGSGFVRLLAGVRNVSAPDRSQSTVGIGAGAGLSIGGVLLDVNWIISPWAEHAPQRLSVSAGYIWSFPLDRRRQQ